jgi:hypothetical protein
MSVTTYNTEKLIAGEIKTQQVKLAADTYYRGMLLKYDADNDRYTYDATAATLGAIFLEDERTVAANGWASVIVGGEVYQGGLVNDSGVALTIDEDFIAAVAPRGFYVKRV